MKINQIVNVSFEDAKRESEAIRGILSKSTKSMIEIGQKFKWFKYSKAYEKLGYATMQEFTEEEYGLKSSAVDNYIKVAKTYSEEKVNNETGEKYIEYSEECDNYSFCQLLAMSKLPKAQRVLISSDASVRTIKNMLKSSEDNSKGTDKTAENDTCEAEVKEEDSVTAVDQNSESVVDVVNTQKDDDKTQTFRIEGTTWEDILSKEAEIKKCLSKKERKYTISIVVSYE